MRLMSLTLILSYWLGWISPTHGPWNGLDWIRQAYVAGLDEFLQSDEGKKWVQSDRGKEWQQRREQLQQQDQEVDSNTTKTQKEGI